LTHATLSVFSVFSVFRCVCVFVCVCHTHTFASLGSSNIGLFCEAYIRAMANNRPDVLKVFLGNLRPDVIKPDVLAFIRERMCLDVVDIFMPSARNGQTAIAFAIFKDENEAAECQADCDGIEDSISIGPIRAHRDANMRVFIAVVSMPQNI